MGDFPYRKNIGLTQEMAERLAFASEQRAKSEPYLVREFLDVGLAFWEAAQQSSPDNE